MSVHALAASFDLAIASPTVKLVLLGLANYSDMKGRCWPSQRELARVTSLSERSVRDALAWLEREGHISREEKRRADGSRAADIITLLFVQPAAPAACGNEQATQPAATAGGGERAAGGGAGRAGLTTFEPSKVISSVANAPEESPPAEIDKVKGTRLKPDWKPKAMIGVDDARLTLALAQSELGKFHDFWAAKPGKDGRKADWEAAWRYWLRNTLDRLPQVHGERSTTTFDADLLAKRHAENRRLYGAAS